jgi:hypothetical protein
MGTVIRLVRRLLPALVMASSVTLLSAGVFNWAPPQTLGEFATPTPDPGDPILDMTPGPTAPQGRTVSPPPTTSPNPSAECWWPGCPYGPYATPISPSPTATPTQSSDVTVTTGDSPPTRIVVPSLGIDLPVVAGDTDFPLCNVAQYLFGFANPGQPGTTYLYGHARTGMFLPLLDESQIDNGAGMIGALVKLYTADLKLHIYQIDIVKQHAVDLSLAYDLGPGQHRLIMQTSEGPHGTIPKLQVAAKPIGIYSATAAEALPTPHPKVCH